MSKYSRLFASFAGKNFFVSFVPSWFNYFFDKR
jgi:hypothetical protein